MSTEAKLRSALVTLCDHYDRPPWTGIPVEEVLLVLAEIGPAPKRCASHPHCAARREGDAP